MAAKKTINLADFKKKPPVATHRDGLGRSRLRPDHILSVRPFP